MSVSPAKSFGPLEEGSLAQTLLLAFLALSVLPLTGLGMVVYYFARQQLVQQTYAQLQTVAEDKRSLLTLWIEEHAKIAEVASGDPETHAALLTVLRSSPPDSAAQAALRQRLAASLYKDLDAYLLLDSTGRVVVSTQPSFEQLTLADQRFFTEGRAGPMTQPPAYDTRLNPTAPIVAAAFPVQDAVNQTRGVLVALFNAQHMAEIFSSRAGLGTTGEIYVVNPQNNLIASTLGQASAEVKVTGGPVDKILAQHADGQSLYKNYLGQQVIGVYQWVPEANLALFVEQSQDAVFARINLFALLLSLILIGLLVAVLVGAAAIARRLTSPLQILTQTALALAEGNLDQSVPFTSQDEIGVLSAAFNTMTARLRESYATLEQRVNERTAELARATEQMRYRAAQLQTSAEVARASATLRDLSELLQITVLLISERFGFYHAGIFLLDDTREWAVLQAAGSPGGQRMLSRGHRLRVGQQGIVGHVTGTGEARIALDVGADAVHFANPDLPETHSEMAVPLKVHNNIIGALDVQSERVNAFTEDDLQVLQTLADQLAIAIDNVRLFQETQRNLEELRELQRQARQAAHASHAPVAYRYDGVDVRPVTLEARPQPEPAAGLLQIPIKTGAETLGVLELKREEAGWSEDDLEFSRAIAERMALALENASLLEETSRRARREQLVAEITSKVRASTDVDTILRTAIQELGAALDVSEGLIRLEVSPAQAPTSEQVQP